MYVGEDLVIRILTIFILIGGLSWYWIDADLKLSQYEPAATQPPYPLQGKSIHSQVEDYIKMVIVGNVRQKVPLAKNLNFTHFSIADISEQKLKAQFTYTFEENSKGKDRMQVEGYATLSKKESGPEQDYDIWKVDKLSAIKSHIVFEEGLTMRVSKKL